MRDLIRNKKFQISISIIVALVTLYLVGFRITYAPWLDNNWDAISATAAWAGAIATSVAIWFAVQSPKKIAMQQNKIALFEKRLECFTATAKLIAFSNQIDETGKTNKDIHAAYKLFLGEPDNFSAIQAVGQVVAGMVKIEGVIISGEFLFSGYDVELVQSAIVSIRELLFVTACRSVEEAEQPISIDAGLIVQELSTTCGIINQSLIPLMEEKLKVEID